MRGRFVLEGLSGLSGDVGETEDEEDVEGDEDEGDNGELLVEGPSSGGQCKEVVLVWTERGAGNFEGLGASSWIEGGG